ncbi:glutathione synthase [soil metagenome]
MKLLFIADPLGSFRIYKDSTYTMMVEAARRGHAIYALEPRELAMSDGVVRSRARRIELIDVDSAGDPHGPRDDWFRIAEQTDAALTEFDAVVMRKDPPFDMEYVTTTWLLEHARRAGARVFNDPAAIRDHNEKAAILEFPQFLAPTLVTRERARILQFHAEHRDIIIKPLDGMGGMGIFRVGPDGLNINSIVETLGLDGARTLMVQRYIPEIVDGDKRVLLIGGTVVPFCLARVPMAGETRGNLAAGGTGIARPLTPRDREIGEALAPVLAARGLLLVGLDVIGNNLTEINVTSPTCFREIMDQTGFDVAALMIDSIEAALEQAA